MLEPGIWGGGSEGTDLGPSPQLILGFSWRTLLHLLFSYSDIPILSYIHANTHTHLPLQDKHDRVTLKNTAFMISFYRQGPMLPAPCKGIVGQEIAIDFPRGKGP